MILHQIIINNTDCQALQQFTQKLQALPPGRYELFIADKRGRSTPQRKYYRGCIVPIISEYTGYEPDEVNEILKAKFNEGRSLEEETPKQVEAIYEAIRRWAALKLDVLIPAPHEVENRLIISNHI